MGDNNIIQLYLSENVRHEQRMSVANEIASVHQVSEKISELRLLSINKASKILGIRYETVVKLVKTGRIKSVMTVNNKYKIPYLSLIEYVKGSEEVKKVTTQVVPIEVTQNRIDNLLKEYVG